MRWWRWGVGYALLWLVFSPLLHAQWDDEGKIVRDIEIKFVGPATVNRALIMANVQTKVGEPYARRLVEQDVRDLIQTGYFFDVRVLQESVEGGVKVIYQVQGKSKIQDIIFEGYKQFKLDRLKRELSFKVGDIYDERKAHVDAQKIVDLYQKAAYPDVKVTPEVNQDRDTGHDPFKVEEGPRVFIQRVVITGNHVVPEARLLKLMKTKRRWWLSWISGTCVLKDEQFHEDLDVVREFYRNQGYLDMEITGTHIERVAPTWMQVHVDIFEGQQYKVGTVAIDGNRLFHKALLLKQLRMLPGQTFTPDGLRHDMKALEDYYGARGYLDTQVRTVRTPNVETARMDLLYVIKEGELNYIERIEIRGNTKTKDKVLRRELAVVPGQVYDTVLIDKSAARLRNLGYFSKVETTPAEVTSVPNHKDLVISVEEQRTGTVTFGAGFSSVDSLVGFVEVTQGNFDLFNWPTFTGGGQKLRVRMQLGTERQDVVLSFTEPWFLDRKLALGFDLFHHEANYLSTDFDETRTGGAVHLEKALSEFWRGQVQYGLQNIDLKVDNNASQELQSQEGTYLRSAVELNLTYDTRDNVFLTLHGNRTELSAEVAGGPLGGDVSVYKLNAKTTFFFPLFNKHVLEIVGAGGVVAAYGSTKGSGEYVIEDDLTVKQVDDVPIFDPYFLGGPSTLRGFGYRDVSPKDINNEPVGGNTYLNGTVEYSFPIVERIRGAVFYDVGSVWEESYQVNSSELRSDFGIGVRLNLPIGPLRLDYGYPIQTVPGDSKSGKIQFSVGYQF